jgi:hypothetical protein
MLHERQRQRAFRRYAGLLLLAVLLAAGGALSSAQPELLLSVDLTCRLRQAAGSARGAAGIQHRGAGHTQRQRRVRSIQSQHQ